MRLKVIGVSNKVSLAGSFKEISGKFGLDKQRTVEYINSCHKFENYDNKNEIEIYYKEKSQWDFDLLHSLKAKRLIPKQY